MFSLFLPLYPFLVPRVFIFFYFFFFHFFSICSIVFLRVFLRLFETTIFRVHIFLRFSNRSELFIRCRDYRSIRTDRCISFLFSYVPFLSILSARLFLCLRLSFTISMYFISLTIPINFAVIYIYLNRFYPIVFGFLFYRLKLECEKLASEKTEMQRHYVMVRHFVSFFLCLFSLRDQVSLSLSFRESGAIHIQKRSNNNLVF